MKTCKSNNFVIYCAAGQELDVRALHEAVAALGGYDAVTTARQWPRVRDALGIDPIDYANANGVLRCALIRNVLTTADPHDRPRKWTIHGSSDHTNGAPVRTRTNHAAQTCVDDGNFKRCSSAFESSKPLLHERQQHAAVRRSLCFHETNAFRQTSGDEPDPVATTSSSIKRVRVTN